MRQILGLAMIVMGILVGLYVGVWIFFLGGIIALVEMIQQDSLTVASAILNVLRILVAGFVGAVCAWALILPGCQIVASGFEEEDKND